MWNCFDSYLRSELTGSACSYGNENCTREALRLFRQYMADENNNPYVYLCTMPKSY